MKIRRLAGPRTHICWTPDTVPEKKRKLVSLVLEADLQKSEGESARLRRELEWANRELGKVFPHVDFRSHEQPLRGAKAK